MVLYGFLKVLRAVRRWFRGEDACSTSRNALKSAVKGVGIGVLHQFRGRVGASRSAMDADLLQCPVWVCFEDDAGPSFHRFGRGSGSFHMFSRDFHRCFIDFSRCSSMSYSISCML